MCDGIRQVKWNTNICFLFLYLAHFSHRSAINSDCVLIQFMAKPVEVFYVGIRLDKCMYQTFIPIRLLIFNYILVSRFPKTQEAISTFFSSENYLGRTLHLCIPEFSMSNEKKKDKIKLKMSLKRLQEMIYTYFYSA